MTEAVQRMSWFDSLSAGKQHTDFFANRVTNYSQRVFRIGMLASLF